MSAKAHVLRPVGEWSHRMQPVGIHDRYFFRISGDRDAGNDNTKSADTVAILKRQPLRLVSELRQGLSLDG